MEKTILVEVNDKKYEVTIKEFENDRAKVSINGKNVEVKIHYPEATSESIKINKHKLVDTKLEPEEDKDRKEHYHKPKVLEEFSNVKAPLPGLILKIFVREGDRVKSGDKLVTMEAMKMENEIISPKSGTIKRIHVREGESVNEDDVLVSIE